MNIRGYVEISGPYFINIIIKYRVENLRYKCASIYLYHQSISDVWFSQEASRLDGLKANVQVHWYSYKRIQVPEGALRSYIMLCY